jgi:glycosyltransferase involved in cell wall biosynthesis
MNSVRFRKRHARHSAKLRAQPLGSGSAVTPPALQSSAGSATVSSIAIVGTVGIPASYGGFETLVENLARFHSNHQMPSRLVVYCSAKGIPQKPATYLGAHLKYIPLSANGLSSVAYDILSLLSAIRQRSDVCLLLGVSGAIAIPLIRMLFKTRIVTNIDGVEWKRAKWKGFSKWFLRFSERLAVRFSHEVIADNQGIAEHVREQYGRECAVIAYGGDHAVNVGAVPYEGQPLPEQYALSVCRVEPENNPGMILEAFAGNPDLPLVFIGNWNHSTFGRELKQRYAAVPHVRLLDPIYDAGVLRTIRSKAALYVHGHSAGGTNPSLVEMMHFGVPVAAYDCCFNRFTTESKALFFRSADSLRQILKRLPVMAVGIIGSEMRALAEQRYTWNVVAREYFQVLEGFSRSGSSQLIVYSGQARQCAN